MTASGVSDAVLVDLDLATVTRHLRTLHVDRLAFKRRVHLLMMIFFFGALTGYIMLKLQQGARLLGWSRLRRSLNS